MANQQPVQQRRGESDAAPREPNAKKGTSSPNNASAPQQRMPPRRTWLSFLFLLLINVVLVRTFFPRGETPVKVPYTLFRRTSHRAQCAGDLQPRCEHHGPVHQAGDLSA